MRATSAPCRSELATFFEAFPYGTVWANTIDGRGYDMVFMGQAEPLQIDLDEVQQRLRPPRLRPGGRIARARSAWIRAIDLFSTYAGQKSDLGALDRQAPRSIAIAICACNTWAAGASTPAWKIIIYRQMMRYRQPAPSPVHRFARSRASHAIRGRIGGTVVPPPCHNTTASATHSAGITYIAWCSPTARAASGANPAAVAAGAK